MKKFKMNKDVKHDKHFYKKGSQVKEDSPGFKVMNDAGHVDEHSFDEGADEAPEAEEAQVEDKKQGRKR